MAWTTAEESRIVAIEEMLNLVQVAVGNLMSKQQMRQLLLIKQAEVDALTERVESLESQVSTLQSQLG